MNIDRCDEIAKKMQRRKELLSRLAALKRMLGNRFGGLVAYAWVDRSVDFTPDEFEAVRDFAISFVESEIRDVEKELGEL